MLHYKLKGMIHAATWKQLVCPQTTHPRPLGRGQKIRTQLLHVAYQIKGITNAATW